ncbi:MAG: Imm7 family immunity protein [Pirellulales bacterium]
MFEFHGWATIQYHSHDTDAILQDRCWNRLVAHVEVTPNDFIRLQRYNGVDSLDIAGQHNHRAEYVIGLFQWVAENAPGSYGLLYVHDDEDRSRGIDHSNCFRVWRLCRGQLDEFDDPFLSPVIPTIEDAHEASRDD